MKGPFRCKVGFHDWEYLNPLWRKCRRCPRQETFKVMPFGWSEWRDEWVEKLERWRKVKK